VFRGAPDLAVEVISPSETYTMIRGKLKEYFQYGVKQVWLVDLESRTVEIHTTLEQSVVLEGEEAISVGDLLPGFSLRATDIFAVLD
jgi:Uma2 family endonuclease